jgi:GT2 family glycosyltransferase
MLQEHRTIAGVVLNWNGWPGIKQCIASIRATRGIHPTIIVVDNGSTDESLKMIEESIPALHIIRLDHNAGLARARNEAIRWAMARNFAYLFFLDDDAHVSPQCLPALLAIAENSPTVGIVTPRILDDHQRDAIWFDGGFINIFGDTVHVNMGRPVPSDNDMDNAPAASDFGTGCCMLVRREVFDAVGLFDEDYFIYSEDADFSLRVRDAGFRIMHAPSATAWHQQSADTKRNRGKWFRDYYVTRNKLLFARRHVSGFKRVIFPAYFAAKYVCVPFVFFLATLQWRRMYAVTQGVVDFLSGKFGERYA